MPRRRPDSFHTCYALAGLSSLQYRHHYSSGVPADAPFASAFAWVSHPILAEEQLTPDGIVFDEADRLQPVHPVFVIPHKAVYDIREWARQQS